MSTLGAHPSALNQRGGQKMLVQQTQVALFLKMYFIEVQLIYNVVLISAVQ